LRPHGPHFLVEPDDVDGDRAVLRGEDAHHLAVVLRAQSGAPVSLADGDGRVYQAYVRRAAPSRVDLALGDAVAVPVVRAQPGRVLVGHPPPLLGLLAARQPAQVGERREARRVGVPQARFRERGIAGDGVVTDERRGLVGHLVRRTHDRHRTGRGP